MTEHVSHGRAPCLYLVYLTIQLYSPYLSLKQPAGVSISGEKLEQKVDQKIAATLGA